MNNSSRPSVSINIPVYKCEKYLLRCLESVKNQTYNNLEIILVNDCTPDNSVKIAQDFISENPDLNIKLIHHEKNQGLSIARNSGIDASSGDYIYMLDSDDYIPVNCIEILLDLALKTDAEITVGQTMCFDSKTNEKKLIFPIYTDKKIIEKNNIFRSFVKGEWPVIAPNKLYKRSFIRDNKIRFVKDLFSQDELWTFHWALKVNKIAFTKETTYIYYLHRESIIFNRTKVNFENYLTILGHFEKEFKKTKNSELKILLKEKIIKFKELVLMMQWRTIKEKDYLARNIGRMQKMPRLSLRDYFSADFSTDVKKKNFFQNLPFGIAAKLFIWRFER